MGLKQGEPLSPILFILFINDVFKTINLNDLTGKDVDLSMYMILFADDIVLFTTNQLSLQAQLDAVYR